MLSRQASVGVYGENRKTTVRPVAGNELCNKFIFTYKILFQTYGRVIVPLETQNQLVSAPGQLPKPILRVLRIVNSSMPAKTISEASVTQLETATES